MGIYTNGLIYGIRITKWIDDEPYTIFEKKDNFVLSHEILNEAKLFYENLNNKNNLLFSAYIECSNTYGYGVYKTWSIISLDTFFNIIKL